LLLEGLLIPVITWGEDRPLHGVPYTSPLKKKGFYFLFFWAFYPYYSVDGGSVDAVVRVKYSSYWACSFKRSYITIS